MLHDSKVTEDKEQFGSSWGVGPREDGHLGVFWTGRTGMAWLYSAIFPFLSVLPLSLDKHSRTPLRFVQLCGEMKDQSNLNGLYWTWKSKALIKHELVSFLPYMYCSIPPFPHRLSFSRAFSARADVVFTAPPKWQNDWVMYECNSACCDVSYIMWALEAWLHDAVERPTDRQTERHLRCAAHADMSLLLLPFAELKPTKMSCSFIRPEMTKHLSMGCHYFRYTNQEKSRVLFGSDSFLGAVVWKILPGALPSESQRRYERVMSHIKSHCNFILIDLHIDKKGLACSERRKRQAVPF